MLHHCSREKRGGDGRLASEMIESSISVGGWYVLTRRPLLDWGLIVSWLKTVMPNHTVCSGAGVRLVPLSA